MLMMPALSAHAGVAQRFSQASRYDMFLPADNPEAANTEQAKPKNNVRGKANTAEADSGEYVPVNYNRIIAESLLAKANSDVNIYAHENNRKVSVPLGKDLTINVIEEESQVCTYECNDKILKYEAGNKENKNLTIVFNAENVGRTKLYVDCVTNSPETGIKVESKVFLITVD